MKHKILEIIQNHPKHYSRIIKNDNELKQWVIDNSLVSSDKWNEMIYSAIYKESDICENGNKKKFSRFNLGYQYCGHSNVCKCSNENLKKTISSIKHQYTNDAKIKINNKRKNTMLQKYGVEYNSQRKTFAPYERLQPEVKEKLESYNWLDYQYNNLKRTQVDIAKELNVYYQTVGFYCAKHGFKIRQRTNYSIIENEIAKFINDQNIYIEQSNWDILNKKEIDIVIHEHKLAIEVNGLYWHSWNPNDKNPQDIHKHLRKTLEAERKGYNLIHITDWEWLNKKDIIKSILLSKLHKNEKIYARKCTINVVGKNQEKIFLNENHLQGWISSAGNIGLWYNNELVQLMSYGISRFDKNVDLELLRLCSKKGITVIGGLSKMLKVLNKNLITYANRDIGSGEGYINTGFKLIKEAEPGYFWTDGSNILSRYKCQKKQLKNWLPNFNSKLSESENMYRNNFRKYWTCGNRKFYYEK